MMTRREFFTRAAAVAAVAVAAPALAADPDACVQVYGACQSGDRLITNGWARGEELQIGDVICIANVHAIHPVTRADAGRPQQFVVTATVSADAAGVMIVPIFPPIRAANSRRQTVSALPANNARVLPLLRGRSVLLGTADVEWMST